MDAILLPMTQSFLVGTGQFMQNRIAGHYFTRMQRRSVREVSRRDLRHQAKETRNSNSSAGMEAENRRTHRARFSVSAFLAGTGFKSRGPAVQVWRRLEVHIQQGWRGSWSALGGLPYCNSTAKMRRWTHRSLERRISTARDQLCRERWSYWSLI